MAISNYAELKAAVAGYAARDDLTSDIPNFIVLAETIFNYGDEDLDIEPLRTRDMEAEATITVTDGEGQLPDDFVGMERVKTELRTLAYITPDRYTEFYPTGDSTDPKFYTVIGANIVVGTNVDIVYYEQIPSLSETPPDDENWLLTKSPNTYLFGALFQLSLFTQAPDKAAGYRGMMAAAMGGLRRADKFSTAGVYERRASMIVNDGKLT